MSASREFNAFGEAAERLYVEERKPLSEIALLLPVSYATLGRWAERGHWDSKREQYETSPDRIIRKLRNSIAELINESGQIDASRADAICKLDKTIARYRKDSKEYFVDMAIAVCSQQAVFIRKRYVDDHAKRQALSEFLTEFLQSVTEEE